MNRALLSWLTFVKKFGCCFTLCLAVALAPGRALAAEPTATELAVARRLFKEATELEAQRRWEEAAVKLREAIRVKDTPGLRFHLAHCEESLGLLVEALLDYDRARDLIAAGARAPDVESLLPDAQRALSRRVPSIVIVSPAGVTDVTASIDGKVVASSVLGRPAPVNPGTHQVIVSAPGYQEFRADVSVTEGERRVLAVKLIAESTSRPAPAPPAKTPRSAPRTSPVVPSSGPSARNYVLVGEMAVTAASLAVGVTFVIAGSRADERVGRANDRVDRVARELGTEPRCDTATGDVLEACRDLSEAYQDRNRYELLATAGFIGAGVGAVATLATYLLWDDTKAPVAIAGGVDADTFWLGATTSF
jgi:hypothetical protein